MNTPTTNSTTALSRWVHFSQTIRGFLGVPLSAVLTAALLVVFIGGCKEETPGIVNVCIAPTVIRTSPANGIVGVALSKTSNAAGPARVVADKIISATFSTPMDPNSITVTTFTVQQGATPISGTVSYSDTTALFVVPNGLGPNLAYTCIITTGAKDMEGTALARNYAWTFTTIAPGTPTLVEPANAAVNISTSPTLIWNAVTGASTYRLQVSTSNTFATTVYNDSTRTNTSQAISGLSVGTTYYWRVNSKISGGTSAYSTVWDFITIAPSPPPILVAPVDGAVNIFTSPTLTWLASTGASTYRLQVSTSSTFATTAYNDSTITGTSKQISPALTVGMTYYWRVNAKNAAGTSAYSTRSFTTIAVAPALQPPILAAPANAAVNISTNPTLSWNASTGADTYRLQVDTNNNFATMLVNDSTITGTSQLISPALTVGTTYYWRVNAKNSSGASAYSTIWSFTVAATPLGGQVSVNLGTASRFAILSNSAITNIPTSAITGDVGISPGARSSIAGLTNPEVIGTIFAADDASPVPAMLIAAKNDAQAAYLDAVAATRGTPTPISGNINGLTLVPGLYESGTSIQISPGGFLYLDAQGDASAVFVIRSATSITTESTSEVVLTNNAQAANIYWVAGSAVTLGTNSKMKGTIIANTSISLLTGARLDGRALIQGPAAGQVSLDQGTIVKP
jgi:Ice-binding-like/Bacterial Ig-like domain